VRESKPWYRADKGAWYARIAGRKVSLGVRGKANKAAAAKAWHAFAATGPPPKPTPTPDAVTVGDAVGRYMADADGRIKASTRDLYRRHLRTLTGTFGRRPVADLTGPALAVWLRGLGVGTTTTAITLRSVSAFLGWCAGGGLIPNNPARSVPKPKSRSRGAEAIIPEAEHATLLALASPALRPMLTILHATGCRPGEACRMTAAAFDRAAGVVVLTEHKGDRTGRPRLIFLPPEAVALLAGLAARHPEGPLLRTRRGRPWTPKAVAWALLTLRKKAGGKATAYGYRHTFATSALAAGVPDATVAALLGHSSTAMLHRHYSHLTSQAATMRDALARVRG